MTIKKKILISMIAVTVICATAVFISAIILFCSHLSSARRSRIDSAASTLNYELERYKSLSNMAAAGIANDEYLIQAIANNDYNAILRQAVNVQNISGMDFCTILDSGGTVLARAHEPDKYGDSLINQSNIQSAVSGKTATFIEQGSEVKLSIRTGAPIYDENNNIIGIVSVGYRLDTFEFVDMMKELTGCEVTIFLKDERISTTVIKEDGTRAVGTKAAPNVIEKVYAGESYVGRAQVVNKDALVKYTPLYGPNDEIIGMVFVGEYTEESSNKLISFLFSGYTQEDTNKIISFLINGIIITIIILTASILFAIFISRTIENQLVNIINKIKSFANNIKTETGELTNISSNLSYGAQKQAASIEETSATMNETASMISQNAENTRQATQIAQETKNNANTGKTKIQEMVKSMNELKESSDTIAKIIKTIDDIAFQTNLLAINATVEAARASGDAGRSFAVVADEVRNLANKSAEAAANTSEIIQKNIMLTNTSKDMSEEVSSALESIIAEFDHLNNLINEITAASEEQTRGVNQINTAIGQIEKLTQQNAAMAQDTTASSNHLQGGILSLEEVISEASKLIQNFPLNNNSVT